MNILITGATGFVGSRLVEKLVKDGHEVTVLSRQASSLANLKDQKVNLCYVSFTDLEVLKKAALGKEVIFHLAGLINAPREKVHLYYQANVSITKSLLKAVDKSVLKAFVYCSSVAVYGKLKKLPTDEKIPPRPDNLYGQTKFEAENICLDFFSKEDIPGIIVRPTWVYGPRDKRTFKLFKAIKKRIFRVVGQGKVLIHPLFVDDLVDALKLCAFNEKAMGEIFIVGGEEVVELNTLVNLIARALDKPLPKIHIPLKLAKTGAFFLEKPYYLFGKRPPLSQRGLEFFTRDQHYDISKAERELSFTPNHTLSEGINLTVDWYRKKGWL